jgi:pimeloyl-ACP methyl ester carboxylesterase
VKEGDRVPEILVNECEFHYEDDDFTDPWEPAETILLQHGFGRSGRFWASWVPLLAGDYRVLRRDMRGHGRSGDPGPDYEFTVDVMASDIIGFLDELELDSVHYVGESISGTLGIVCATRWPERFKSLTLCAAVTYMTPVGAPVEDDPMAVDGLDRATAPAALGVGAWAEGLMVPGKLSGDGSPQRREWLIREWDKTPRHVAKNLMACVSGVDVESLLGQVSVPTLVMAPTRSLLQPLPLQLHIHEAIPGARFAAIDGPGHEFYLDRPEESTAALRRFLAELQ